MNKTLTDRHRAALARFADAKILVLGDLIIDHFIWGTVNRISPEAPVPVVNVTRENLLLGGAANVLNNIYALGGKGEMCGVIGPDSMGEHLLELLHTLDSPTSGIIKSADRPTTKKTRVIAQHQQVVRFDREKSGALPQPVQEELFAYLDQHLASFQAVVVSDYNKGVVSSELMTRLMARLKHHQDIPVIVDPKPNQLERFTGATILTPNLHEAEKMAGISITSDEDLCEAARIIKERLGCAALLITRGEAGMALFEAQRQPLLIPTTAQEVYDVTGAGDTVIATLALGLAVGLSFSEAAILANRAAGIVVGKLGTATVTPEELFGDNA
ncbi:MAG: D-glycero-beta-D-manno-heptose-7-phosphate kinase [Desulfobulbaceae bacterium]|nr:D-glycero-beta-D-manno-heptose-7-phosphate kinase [Desulfobulbaceae bacterium]